MRIEKNLYQAPTNPPRCQNCGRPNPDHDEGYTLCCNEPEIDPGDFEYQEAAARWSRRS